MTKSHMGWKMPLCQWHTFLIAPCLVFFVILFYIERNKWQRNLAAILPFKSKLSGKFQSFNAIDISIEMLKDSWIFNNFK